MIDIESLLRPINDLQVSGKDLTYSIEFDDVQKLRRFDDPTLDQGEWVTDLKVANWPEVVKSCMKLLQESSKDLRLAGWLTEALVHTQGFAGMAQGYELLARLSERFWESLYPEAEDGDQEQRVGSIAWVLTQSQRWILSIPVVNNTEERYCLSEYSTAHLRSGASRLGEPVHATLEQMERAREATSVEFYQGLWNGIQAAKTALGTLEDAMERQLGDRGPSFSATRDVLHGAFESIERFARGAGVETLPAGEVALDVSGELAHLDVVPVRTTAVKGSITGEITSRQEALVMLRKVAVYFREAEPHSPAAYMAEQAAKWGAMPLHEWLKEVLKKEASLERLEELLGVKPGTEK